MSRPTGAATRSRSASAIPCSRRLSKISRILRRLPISPTYDARRRRQVIEGLLVVAVPAGHDQGVGLRRDLERAEDLLDRPDQDALGRREPLGLAYCWRSSTTQTSKSACAARLATACPTCPAPTITSRMRGQLGKKATPLSTDGLGRSSSGRIARGRDVAGCRARVQRASGRPSPSNRKRSPSGARRAVPG